MRVLGCMTISTPSYTQVSHFSCTKACSPLSSLDGCVACCMTAMALIDTIRKAATSVRLMPNND